MPPDTTIHRTLDPAALIPGQACVFVCCRRCGALYAVGTPCRTCALTPESSGLPGLALTLVGCAACLVIAALCVLGLLGPGYGPWGW